MRFDTRCFICLTAAGEMPFSLAMSFDVRPCSDSRNIFLWSGSSGTCSRTCRRAAEPVAAYLGFGSLFHSSGFERTRKPASLKSRTLRVWNSSTPQYLSVSARRTSWMRRLAKLRDAARRHTAFMTSGDDGTSTTAQAGLLRYDDITATASPAESGFFCRTGLRKRQYNSTSVCSATTKLSSSACDSRNLHAASCFGSSGQDAAKRMFVSHETICMSPLFVPVVVDPRAPVFICERIGTKAGRTTYGNRPSLGL